MRIILATFLLLTACKSRDPGAATFSTGGGQNYLMEVTTMEFVSSEYGNGTDVSAGIGYLFCNPDHTSDCTGNSNHWFLNSYKLGADSEINFKAPVMPGAPYYQSHPFDGLRSHVVMDAWFKAGIFHNTRKARFSADVDLSQVDTAADGKLVVDFPLESGNDTWSGSTLRLTFTKVVR